MTYVSDIERLKEFMVGNNNAEEVKALNDDPINLLIKAAYGFTDCEKLRRNKLVFNEKFLHLYAYLIVAVHRAIFEGGKCAKELLEIMNYLEPYDHDSRVLRDFYNEVYRVMRRGGNYVDNVYELYNEFKNIGTNSLSSQVIKTVLAYMGVRGIVSMDELSDFFKPEIYVDFNEVSEEDAIKYLGYIPIEYVDERTVLNYYKGFARRIEGNIARINRETFIIKLLMIGLRLVKWLSKYKELDLQNKIEKRIRVVKNKEFHDKITLM
ncbi:MAG: hypothetical protein RXN93_09315 [Thermocladium sp.]